MDYSMPDSSICGDIQAKILEWVAMSSSRGSSLPRNQTHVSYIYLCWGAGSLPLAPIGKPARLPCPPLSPRVCSNSCPLNRWCHPAISSSVVLLSPFSKRLLSPVFPSIRVFSSELCLCISWPKHWRFRFADIDWFLLCMSWFVSASLLNHQQDLLHLNRLPCLKHLYFKIVKELPHQPDW